MTFPSGGPGPTGGPGGFPGQGPQQPQQPFPGPGPSGRSGPKFSPAQILYLVTAGLGVLNLFLGFLNLSGEVSFYESLTGWVPALLFVAGLSAVLAILPGDDKPGPWPGIISVGVILAFLFSVFQTDSLSVGGIMVLILGLVETVAAVGAYLFEAGIIKPPAPQPSYPYGQPMGQQPQGQPGQFGQPGSGGFPQPTAYNPQGAPGQQPGQPGQAQPGPQAPGPQSGQQPMPQQTQYASQQGQFFHQGPENGPNQGG